MKSLTFYLIFNNILTVSVNTHLLHSTHTIFYEHAHQFELKLINLGFGLCYIIKTNKIYKLGMGVTNNNKGIVLNNIVMLKPYFPKYLSSKVLGFVIVKYSAHNLWFS